MHDCEKVSDGEYPSETLEKFLIGRISAIDAHGFHLYAYDCDGESPVNECDRD